MFFFEIHPWFNTCFIFLTRLTYSVLSCKLVTSFSTFSIFILSSKNDKSLWSSCNFSEYWTSTSTKYPSTLYSLQFLMKSSFKWEVTSIHSNLVSRSFYDIAQPYKLYVSQYLRDDDSLFLSYSFIHWLLPFTFYILMNNVTYFLSVFFNYYLHINIS